MSKHSSGPWRVVISDNGDRCEIEDANGDCVARVFAPFPFDTSWDERDANAALIALAPDLLFQLLAASNYIDALGGDSKSYRAAIAKATGEQQ